MRGNIFNYASLCPNMKLFSAISNKPKNEESKYRLLCASKVYLCVCVSALY